MRAIVGRMVVTMVTVVVVLCRANVLHLDDVAALGAALDWSVAGNLTSVSIENLLWEQVHLRRATSLRGSLRGSPCSRRIARYQPN